MWLSGLSAGLRTERSPVQFQVRAYAWVTGQIPSVGRVRGNGLMYLLHTDVSFPLLKNGFCQVTPLKHCSSSDLFPYCSSPYAHNPHPIHTFDCIPLSQSCTVGFVILVSPLSFRKQSGISSDHYRALPHPLRAHSQDHQSGVESTPRRKAGVCLLRRDSSGTMAAPSLWVLHSAPELGLPPPFPGHVRFPSLTVTSHGKGFSEW